jgi:isohexenylglutaconyl-CoA hydratase
MTLPDATTLLLERREDVLYITLNRPDSRNAMNLAMLEELHALLAASGKDRSLRAIVLRGAGGHFCAGGDIKDMAAARSRDRQGQAELNRSFGRLLEDAAKQPQVLITVLEGAVLGGGLGLASVSDIAICRSDCHFGLPETSLGLIPAQIAPFVVRRIGLTQTRRLALTAARFDGLEALRLGLVHYCETDADALERQLVTTINQVLRCAPDANIQTKALLLASNEQPLESVLDQAADIFANAVTGKEAAEGTMAFVQKRKPRWAPQNAS